MASLKTRTVGCRLSIWNSISLTTIVCALGVLAHTAHATDLVVQSSWGAPTPPVGTNSFTTGATISATVAGSPIPVAQGMRLACTGWIGTGDVPSDGSTTNTGSFELTNGSSVTWLWETQALITISRARGGGSLVPGTAWHAFGTTQRVTATAHELCSFVGWQGDTNDCSIDGDAIDIPVDGQRFITAEFSGGPWAYKVVDYSPGANAQAGYDDPISAIGMPERVTGEGVFPGDVSPFNASWLPTETCSVGAGGQLVVAFDSPVSNDVLNPYGIDLLVFGNAFFGANDYSPRAEWILSEPGAIFVSQDGTNWFEIPNVTADHTFPTMGFTDTSTSTTYGNDGTTPTDFLKPVDPELNWANMTFARLQPAYNGSGGGAPVDIGSVGLDWIRYVMISQALDQTWSTEIDAFSDVAPAPTFALVVHTTGRGQVTPPGRAFANGTNLTLMAAAATHFHFGGWSGMTQGDTNNTSMTLLMDRDRTITATFLPDLTSTLTPTYWLFENNLTNATYPTFEAAASADHDDDGENTWAEYLAGTDPEDPDSIFKILAVGTWQGTNYVTWLGGANGSALPFTVVARTNLMNDGGQPLAQHADRAATGTNTWRGVAPANSFISIEVRP